MEEIERGHARPGPDPDAIAVEEIMTPNVITVAPDAHIAEVARLMRRERIGAVPVVEGEHVVGIVARSDLLDAFATLTEARG